MKTFEAVISIDAGSDAVWRILTNAAEYPRWNPTVDKVEGQIAPGGRVTVYAKANPGRAFPLKVTDFIPEKRMVWSGGMPFGLFKGERTFTLTPTSGSALEFRMRESFSGPLAGLIGKSIPDLQPSFDAFAAALKKTAESGK